MKEIFPQLTFDITVKIEHILKYPHHVAELQNLGCLFVVSAVESFSNVVLEKLDKGHTRSDIYEALGILKAINLPLRPSLLAFTPWTTLVDYLDLLEQIEALHLIEQLDPVQYSIRLLVPPHSALLYQAGTKEWLGPLDAPNLVYQWDHPDPRMDSLYQAVSSLVASAAEAGEDARTNFYRLKALAYAVALGRPLDEVSRLKLSGQTSSFTTSAKLTENWFC